MKPTKADRTVAGLSRAYQEVVKQRGELREQLETERERARWLERELAAAQRVIIIARRRLREYPGTRGSMNSVKRDILDILSKVQTETQRISMAELKRLAKEGVYSEASVALILATFDEDVAAAEALDKKIV